MIPFWSLNDRLEIPELERQIEKMKEAGIRGFFLHARGGLETPYMGDEWFDCIEACVKKAVELDMEPWLYDENGWPSGFADGAVPAEGEAFQQKRLECAPLADDAPLPEHLLGLYRVADGQVTRLAQREPGAWAAYYKVNRYYVDSLSREATDRFIQHTHERYYQRLKPYFDGRIRGFFTDEPQYASGRTIPWSPWLQEEWRRRYGSEVTDALPLLFTDAAGSDTFRYRYYSVAADLLAHNFMEPLYNWCTAHHCELTGHMMSEDTMTSQTYFIGAAMPHYAYFHKPGIDHLCRHINNPLVPKQLSSAAAQLGRPTITETFAGCGWDVRLDELKWIAEWQYVNGVTDICPHLQGYTLRGLRKRDWPASLFVQQPWFDEAYPHFARYFADLGAALRSGTDAAELLVIHPIKSGYTLFNPKDNTAIQAYDRQWLTVTQALNNHHIAYHLGDETLMESLAHVEGDTLVVGRCRYRAVLMPNLIGVSASTLALLTEFVAGGGQLLYMGRTPDTVDGAADERAVALSASAVEVDYDELARRTASLSVTTDGVENSKIHTAMRRLDGGARLMYLANLSDEPQKVVLTLPAGGHLTRRLLQTGTAQLWPLNQTADGATAALAFEGYEDALLLWEPGEKAVEPSAETVYLPLKNRAAITQMSENVLTLDFCRFRIDGGEWQPETYVLQAHKACEKVGRPCDVELVFTFDVADPSVVGTLDLAVECPDKYEFTLNGQPYTFVDRGYFVDTSFRRGDVRPYLRAGQNELTMKTHFAQKPRVYELYATPGVHESEWNKLTLDSELESVYLVGQFGVQADTVPTPGKRHALFAGHRFALTARPTKVDVRDLTAQGFWFFSGTATLTQTVSVTREPGRRYALKLHSLRAAAATVTVNGRAAGMLAFAPYECDVTDYLRDGDNEISVTLYSGLRNTLGPHHLEVGELYVVDPTTFKSYDSVRRDFDGTPIGWTDNYSFVTFGMQPEAE